MDPIATAKSQLTDLMNQRDVLDDLIKTYGELITAEMGNDPTAMTAKLTDAEGFPLAQVNIPVVADARQQISQKQNLVTNHI